MLARQRDGVPGLKRSCEPVSAPVSLLGLNFKSAVATRAATTTRGPASVGAQRDGVPQVVAYRPVQRKIVMLREREKEWKGVFCDADAVGEGLLTGFLPCQTHLPIVVNGMELSPRQLTDLVPTRQPLRRSLSTQEPSEGVRYEGGSLASQGPSAGGRAAS